MHYVIKINGRKIELAFKTKRRAIEAALASAKAEGGITEFAEYAAGKGAWVCSRENQFDVRRCDIEGVGSPRPPMGNGQRHL